MARKKTKRRKKKKNPEKRYPNQQMVYINKKISHNKKGYFTIDALKTLEAMRTLTGTAFKMYIYLSQYPNGKTLYLSGSDFCKSSGITGPTYISAKKDLINHHYLFLREDGDFDFYNEPTKIPTRKEEIMEGILNKIKEENTLEEELQNG